MPFGLIEASFLGIVLEGVFYGNLLFYTYDVPIYFYLIGLYCIIFVLYLRVQASKRSDDRNILIYPISSLFVLCTTLFGLSLVQGYLTVVSKTSPTVT